MKLMCKHCRTHKANRPRGLCWTCYYTPVIRARYDWRNVGGSGNRGISNGNFDPPPCPEPTSVMPGPAKVAILAARAEAGVSLWHPRDTQGE